MKDKRHLRELVKNAAETAGINAEFGGECPCGQIFAVDMEKIAVAHTMPMCTEYENMPVDEYLRFLTTKFTN